MSNVTVAFQNKVEASEAARHLGCAYSTIVALLAKKKLKGQKINRRWFVDFDDLQRAKSTHLIKTRVSRKQRERLQASNAPVQVFEPIKAVELIKNVGPNGKAELRFYFDRDKVSVLQAALQSVDRGLTEYVQDKMEELYQKVRESLRSIKV